MTFNERIPASSTLLYHRAIARYAASFMVFFENIIRREWHKPYAFLISGYSSNAKAESFNAKIKLFRANLSGVADKKFFLFHIANAICVSPLKSY